MMKLVHILELMLEERTGKVTQDLKRLIGAASIKRKLVRGFGVQINVRSVKTLFTRPMLI
jgi:hypothetical protein